MRAVVQRVSEARVEVDGHVVGSIGRGMVVLVAAIEGDEETDARRLADKIGMLRIFPGDRGTMDLSLLDIGGSLLVISQFTLAASLRRGRRPEFLRAMKPDDARTLIEFFVQDLRAQSIPVETGMFGASMKVALVNEGPVTLIIDTDELKGSRSSSSSDPSEAS